jgi:phospho-N-acetylmuramoyl-pentapeptide-transferase
LLLSTIYGKRIIRFAKSANGRETVRELGLAGQNEKRCTPTMGLNYYIQLLWLPGVV